MDNKSLFAILSQSHQPPQAQAPLAPLPSGNIGAGGSQPLQLGPQVAENDVGGDAQYKLWRALHPKLDEGMAQTVYKQAVLPGGHQGPPPPQQQAQVNPYQNFANKVTGQEYK
jgi:hypothetical protein